MSQNSRLTNPFVITTSSNHNQSYTANYSVSQLLQRVHITHSQLISQLTDTHKRHYQQLQQLYIKFQSEQDQLQQSYTELESKYHALKRKYDEIIPNTE